MIFFFFQAEDGIRDTSVTGVQTCALPIWLALTVSGTLAGGEGKPRRIVDVSTDRDVWVKTDAGWRIRSEERREGKRVDVGGGRRSNKKKGNTNMKMNNDEVIA